MTGRAFRGQRAERTLTTGHDARPGCQPAHFAMKHQSLQPYADAIAFAQAIPEGPGREYWSPSLYVYCQRGRDGRPDLDGKLYLDAFEKVPGGLVHLNWWAPGTLAGVKEFFRGLAGRTQLRVSPRPYRLGQACDGTIDDVALHAYKIACEALGLNADQLYRMAYADRDEQPPAWESCRRMAEWQGGVRWPKRWDVAAIVGVAESLTEINYHSLRGEFEEAALARIR